MITVISLRPLRFNTAVQNCCQLAAVQYQAGTAVMYALRMQDARQETAQAAQQQSRRLQQQLTAAEDKLAALEHRVAREESAHAHELAEQQQKFVAQLQHAKSSAADAVQSRV